MNCNDWLCMLCVTQARYDCSAHIPYNSFIVFSVAFTLGNRISTSITQMQNATRSLDYPLVFLLPIRLFQAFEADLLFLCFSLLNIHTTLYMPSSFTLLWNLLHPSLSTCYSDVYYLFLPICMK